MTNTLIILLGPTAVGKTELSLRICEHFRAPLISADSRQIYKSIPIGTAAPTAEEQARVRHYLVGTHDPADYYSAACFETDVLNLLRELFTETHSVLMCGGSMMYIDAIAKGIDEMPTILPEIRKAIYEQYEQYGLQPLLDELAALDPVHYNTVDRKNHKRVIHALEVCRQTGLPYTSFRINKPNPRPFRMIKIGLLRKREELNERINSRVDAMIAAGLEAEARRVYPLRNYNSLNTVGYKELFTYFDGECTLDYAIEKIKRNTRLYARKQMTWFKRDASIAWFHPEEEEKIMNHIKTTQ